MTDYDWRVDDTSDSMKEFAKDGFTVSCGGAWDEKAWGTLFPSSFDTSFTLGMSTYSIHIHFAGSVPKVKTAADQWGRKVLNVKLKTPSETRIVAWPTSATDKRGVKSLAKLAEDAAGYPTVKKVFLRLDAAWEAYKVTKAS